MCNERTKLNLAIVLIAMALGLGAVVQAAPMGTAFTYQGHLYDNNDVADGLYDFQFKLFDDPNIIIGNQVGGDVNKPNVDVIAAQFTVELDFGSDVFDGDARWLEIGVRPGDFNDPNVYTILQPRQEVTPTPYALQTRGIFVDDAGNVGIGTTTPGAKLEVVGSVMVSGTVDGVDVSNHAANANAHHTPPTSLPPSGSAGGDLSGSYPNPSVVNDSHSHGNATVSDNISINNTRLYAPATAGNVGIGTTKPRNKLDVEGAVAVGASYSGTNTGPTNGMIIEGNVGIGTTNPLSKLSVGGDGFAKTGVYGSGSTYGVRASGGTYGVRASGGSYGVYGSGSYAGVYGSGSLYGVYGDGTYGVYGGGSEGGVVGYCYDGSGTNYGLRADAGSTGSNDAYGVYSKVFRSGSGNYWSGYFSDFLTGGTYNGLYADLRSGAAIDVAEYILDTKGDTEAGDVLAADPDNDESVIKSSIPYDSAVVGIVSTEPHLLMGMELVMDEETGEMYEDVNATKLALAGRVPVKVTDENGPIERGDLLTTSSKSGYAMKWTLLDVSQAEDFDELKSMLAENERRRNAVVGKALGNLDSGDGRIVALVNLQ